MEIFQEVLELLAADNLTASCVDITGDVQKVVNDSRFDDGIVLVHTLHTTTGLTKSRQATSGFFVQEKEPLLLADFGEILDEGAEKFLQTLPQIKVVAGRERFLDIFPRGLLEALLSFLIAVLRPTGYLKHDDFSIRTENMSPDERKNAMAHLKAAMIRESLLWSFSGGKLNLGKWQSMLFWDFDSKERDKRKIQVVVIGNKQQD
jgi:thiamine phosphate synthase YjbQ (UPF0047 family)